MPIQANDIQTLHDYAQGMMKRATHHARNVGAISLALIGGVIWRAEPGSIEIKQYDGDLANLVWWVSVATQKKYVCAYNHKTGEIEIRDRTTQGTVLYRFTNDTAAADVENVFAKL